MELADRSLLDRLDFRGWGGGERVVSEEGLPIYLVGRPARLLGSVALATSGQLDACLADSQLGCSLHRAHTPAAYSMYTHPVAKVYTA